MNEALSWGLVDFSFFQVLSLGKKRGGLFEIEMKQMSSNWETFAGKADVSFETSVLESVKTPSKMSMCVESYI